MIEHGNQRTVYVVQVDNNKDLSDAKKYGRLRAVFGNPRKPYDTANMLAKARRVMAEWQVGDHLLMIGDPTLCAVCMAVVSEDNDAVNVLSWDRNSFSYQPQLWNFSRTGLNYDDDEDDEDVDFENADD
jgi:hypothetical protein